MSKPSLTVVKATYHGIDEETDWCWTRDAPALWQRYDLHVGKWPGDALIHRARSKVLTDWHEQADDDVLLFVDRDIIWNPGSLERIADTCHEIGGIVGAVVPKRCLGQGIASVAAPGIAGFQTGIDAVYPAVYVGAGLMAVHRTVLDKLAPTLPLVVGKSQYRPYCWPELIDCERFPGLKEDLSEDWALCWRWRKAGGECWLDAMPVVAHRGPYTYQVSDAAYSSKGPQPLDYVVLGCPHSGTGYMSRLLTSAGVPCGHEDIFTFDVRHRLDLRADSSFFAVAHVKHPIAADARKVHVVRNPLMVVRSWFYAGTYERNDNWMRLFVDLPLERTLEALGHRWVKWNELIETSAPDAIRVRAEDRTAILSRLGLQQVRQWDDPEYNRKPGAINAPQVTLEQLGSAAPEVKAMAERYGYNL